MSEVKVYRRDVINDRHVSLRITGASKVATRLDRPAYVLPEFLEFTIDELGVQMVVVTGPGLRKNGTFGVSREVGWWWRVNRDEIPEWIQDLVRADPAVGGGAS